MDKRISKQPQLYHFTCAHGFAGISTSSALKPYTHPLMRHLGPLLWLTDLEAPSAEDVGLTSTLLSCDRLAYRYRVHSRAAVPWSALRGRAPRTLLAVLESYGEPSHWWVVRRLLTASEFTLDQAPQLREEPRRWPEGWAGR
jgi:hypothetical protein